MPKSVFLAAVIAVLSQAAPAQELSEKFERYEGGSAASEQALIDQLTMLFGFVQAANAIDGRPNRGTHAQGSCAAGLFKVLDLNATGEELSDDVKEFLAQGLYESPHEYPAFIRFANGSSAIKADTENDVRSLSFAVDLGAGKRQDYSMNSHAIFPIPSLTAFNVAIGAGLVQGKAIKEALAAGKPLPEAQAAAKLALENFLAKLPPDVAALLPLVQALGAEVTSAKVGSYRNTPYWSGSAFKHGDTMAVKYLAEPCVGTLESPLLETPAPHYLQDELRAYVNSDQPAVCFNFRIQFLDADKMQTPEGKTLEAWQWVEDPTLNWDTAGAKSYKVAELTVTPHSMYAKENCDDPQHGINVNVNSLPEHLGMGRINRGRTKVEQSSRQSRQKK